MNTPIKTNQIIYTLNHDKFDKQYDIFAVATSEKYFRTGAYIIDAPALDKMYVRFSLKKAVNFML